MRRRRDARAWWERRLSARQHVAEPWIVAHGFIRLMTHPRVLQTPLRTEIAFRHVRDWIRWPSVQVIEAGRCPLDILEAVFSEPGVTGPMTTDAILAAYAIEYQPEIHSNDVDFARFPGVRCINPLNH